MKILLVVTKSNLGGAQNFVLNLALGLKNKGHEVVVGGGPGRYLPLELQNRDISFHRFQKLERSFNLLKNFSFARELRGYVERNDFEIVHLNSSNALFGVWGLRKLKARPRLVFTVHGLSLLDKNYNINSLFKKISFLFFKFAFRSIDRVIFVSKLNLEFAQKKGLVQQGALIYNGFDVEDDFFLSREEARSKLNEMTKQNLKSAYICGSIGRLAYPKNYEFLINSFRELKAIKPEAKLVLIGEGPERKKYEAMIKSYSLRKDIILLGEIAQASRYLKAFDLFVLPSVFEGLSLVLIEALKAQIPVLASRVGGNEEVVGVDHCFPLNDRQEFLKKVKKSISVPKVDDRFNLESMVKKYEEIYRV